MQSAISHDTLVIAIDNNESLRLMAGETIMDRNSPFYAEAKTIVRPLTDLDPFYIPASGMASPEFDENLKKYRCIAQLLGDMDVIVYVPLEVPTYALIAAETIEHKDVQAMVADENKSGLLATLPPCGIQIRFDGRIPA